MVKRFHCGHSDFYISKYPVYGLVLDILIQRSRTLLAHLAQHPADSLVDKVERVGGEACQRCVSSHQILLHAEALTTLRVCGHLIPRNLSPSPYSPPPVLKNLERNSLCTGSRIEVIKSIISCALVIGIILRKITLFPIKSHCKFTLLREQHINEEAAPGGAASV